MNEEHAWLVYGAGVLVSLMMFYAYRSFMNKEDRCHALWYIPIGLFSWAVLILAFAIVLVEAVGVRDD